MLTLWETGASVEVVCIIYFFVSPYPVIFLSSPAETVDTIIMLAGGLRHCDVVGLCKPFNRVNAMSFKSKQNLLKLINKENKISPELTFDDVDISLPEVVSVDGRDSQVVLTSKLKDDEGSQVTVDYHRRPLEDYLKDDNVFGDEDLTTTHDLLAPLNERFGLNILPEDIEDHPIEGSVHDVIAELLSHEWRSEAQVQIIKATPLADVITNTALDGLLYPDHQDATDTVGQAYIYSRSIDCSHIMKFLSTLAVGIDVDDTALAVELNKCVPEVWVAVDDAAPYNLKDSTVVFDGVPADLPGANPAFDRVVSVRLTSLCTNFQGDLILHYNN